jgi:hypothetical protein
MNRLTATQRIVAVALVGAVCLAAGCKKPAKPATEVPKAAQQEPPAASPSAATNTEPKRLDEAPASIFNLDNATVLKPVDVRKLTPSQIQFGIAPKRTKDIEYVDDVIVMEEGDRAIRSMATNGLSWTFDAHAPHVSEFQEGKIVFATGLAVGKIVSLKREGDQVTAVLAPVQLTDVIKNGSFAMNQPLDVDNMISYAAPDFPQSKEDTAGQKSSSLDERNDGHFVQAVVVSRVSRGKWTPASMVQTFADGRRISYRRHGWKWTDPHVSVANVSPLRLINNFERIRLATPPSGDPEVPVPPPASKANFDAGGPPAQMRGAPTQLDVSDARAEAVASNSGIGVQFYYDKKGIKLFTECLLETIGANIEFKLVIRNAHFETAGIKIGGHLGVKLLAEAGTTGDFQANFHKKIWIPIDFKIPLGLNDANPSPFSVTFNSMLDVSTGFSAKTSVLKAEGHYTFGGGLWAGLDQGTWSVSVAQDPKAEKDLGVTTTGTSVGINSLVVAAGVRTMVGIGAFGFDTGVFTDIIFAGTLLRGSDVTTFACRQGTIEASLDYGIGYQLNKTFVDAINAVLSLFTSYRLEYVGTIAQSKLVRLFHGNTQIPGGCATPKGGG